MKDETLVNAEIKAEAGANYELADAELEAVCGGKLFGGGRRQSGGGSPSSGGGCSSCGS